MAQVLYSATNDHSALRRGTDFYDEGALIWLEADTLIRKQTNGQKSLDDFCRIFHGGESRLDVPQVKPYTFDEVVATLNQVAPYDWRAFLTQRLTATGGGAPLGRPDEQWLETRLRQKRARLTRPRTAYPRGKIFPIRWGSV